MRRGAFFATVLRPRIWHPCCTRCVVSVLVVTARRRKPRDWDIPPGHRLPVHTGARTSPAHVVHVATYSVGYEPSPGAVDISSRPGVATSLWANSLHSAFDILPFQICATGNPSLAQLTCFVNQKIFAKSIRREAFSLPHPFFSSRKNIFLKTFSFQKEKLAFR